MSSANIVVFLVPILMTFISQGAAVESGLSSIAECSLTFVSGSYLRSEDDLERLFVVDQDGNNLQRLTDIPAYSPVWSPDATRIAFVSLYGANDLYLLDLETNTVEGVAQDLLEYVPVTWSPDGTHIAFVTNLDDTGQNRLNVVNFEDSPIVTSIHNDGIHLFPAWSPDGTQIAFTLGFVNDTNIYTIDADGKNPQLLAEDASHPQWSPDGNQLAFVARGNRPTGVYLINSDGSDVRLLAADAGFPAWSPNGERIAFVSMKDGNEEIYLVGTNGTNQKRLTYRQADDTQPKWSPDGNHIAFRSDHEMLFGESIWVMADTGKDLTRLQFDLLGDFSWTPLC